MGYRANVITQHRSYGSQVFCNYNKFEEWLNFVRDEYEVEAEMIHEDEGEAYFEIPKVIFEKEIERLEKLPKDQIEEHLDNEVEYVLDDMRDALKDAVEADDFVALEWW